MKTTEDIRTHAVEQAFSEEEALQRGMAEKNRAFVQTGGELYKQASGPLSPA
jgi:phosphomethylpyrimidine synthase